MAEISTKEHARLRAIEAELAEVLQKAEGAVADKHAPWSHPAMSYVEVQIDKASIEEWRRLIGQCRRALADSEDGAERLRARIAELEAALREVDDMLRLNGYDTTGHMRETIRDAIGGSHG